jgi:hypothetical protein
MRRLRKQPASARGLDLALTGAESGRELADDEIELLITTASNPSNAAYKSKLAAVRAIRQMPLPAEARARAAAGLLMQADVRGALLDEAGRFKRALRVFGLSLLAGVILILPGLLVSWLLQSSPLFLTILNAVGWVLAFASCPLALVQLAVDGSRLIEMRVEATCAIASLKVAETTSVVFRNTRSSHQPVKTAAVGALPALLPAIIDGELPLLPKDAEDLCLLLRGGEDDLVYLILETLRLYGGGSQAGDLEWLVAHGRTQPIREAAAHVLPVLQQRLRREQEQNVLLRASDAPEDSPAHLLRPISTAPDGEPSTLLRADMSDAAPEGAERDSAG